MNIDAIKDGYVIDHIKAGDGLKLFYLLGLDSGDTCAALIKNAASKKLGRKDIIKIDSDIDVNLDVIGYVDPTATVNIIKDGNLIKKLHPPMPELLTNVIKCKNPRCITMTEQELDHIFRLTDKDKKIYRCIYCETKAN